MPKSVTRNDKRYTHGWQVRVQWKGKRLPSKFFSDRVYGGQAASLQAAIEYRDQLEASVKKPRTERTVQSLFKRNTSGAPGVYLSWRTENGPGRTRTRHRVWVYTYPKTPGVVGHSTVSVKKWGLRGGKKRAIQLRASRLAAYHKETP